MLKGKKILIVDDNENECKTLKNILDKSGYDTFTAGNFDEAVGLSRETNYDLIFVDLVFKNGRNGVDIFKEIRGIRPNAKVILFTGYGPEEEMGLLRDAIIAGMGDEFLRKPIWPEELIKVIEKHTGGRING